MEISIKWNICRVCLQEEEKSDKGLSKGKMIQIFTDGNKLAQQIFDCAGIPMKQNDSLPDKICRKCFAILKYAVHFRKSCRESNDYLQSVIQRTKSASTMFKHARNSTESLIETLAEDDDLVYEYDNEQLVQIVTKCVESNENTIVEKSEPQQKQYKRNQPQQQSLKKKKKIKLNEPINSETETRYAATRDYGNKYKQQKNITEQIIVLEDDEQQNENCSELEEEFIKESEETIQNEYNNNTEEEISNPNSEQGSISDVNIEKPRKITAKTRMNILNNQHAIKVQVFQDKDEPAAVKDANSYSEETFNKSTEVEIIQNMKSEKNDDELYFIVNKENQAAGDNQHQHEGEDYNASDDNVDFIPLEEDEEVVVHDLEEETELCEEDSDNQGQVTSTVITKEEVDFDEEENTNESENSQDMQAEYVIDGFVIESNDPHDPLMHSNIIKNNKNISRQSENVKEQQQSGGEQTVLGRRKMRTSQHAVKEANSTINSGNILVCDICGNNFTSRQILNAHMKIHRQEKSHECELCFKRFITACNLQAHMRIHTGEKPYECKFCGRRFTDRSTHLRHERIHTNEKPFGCDYCGKAFALATTLHAHLKVHTGERPYKCDPCSKSFKLPHQLKAHRNTHLHKAVEQLNT